MSCRSDYESRWGSDSVAGEQEDRELSLRCVRAMLRTYWPGLTEADEEPAVVAAMAESVGRLLRPLLAELDKAARAVFDQAGLVLLAEDERDDLKAQLASVNARVEELEKALRGLMGASGWSESWERAEAALSPESRETEPPTPRHVCGLTGYNPMIDPPCEGPGHTRETEPKR